MTSGETKPAKKPKKRTPRVETTVVSIRLPVTLYRELNKRADRRDVYTSSLIKDILEAAVKTRKSEADSPQGSIFG